MTVFREARRSTMVKTGGGGDEGAMSDMRGWLARTVSDHVGSYYVRNPRTWKLDIWDTVAGAALAGWRRGFRMGLAWGLAVALGTGLAVWALGWGPR